MYVPKYKYDMILYVSYVRISANHKTASHDSEDICMYPSVHNYKYSVHTYICRWPATFLQPFDAPVGKSLVPLIYARPEGPASEYISISESLRIPSRKPIYVRVIHM